MRMKQNVLDLTDKIRDLIETTKRGVEKRAVDTTGLLKILYQLDRDMDRIITIVKREPDEV